MALGLTFSNGKPAQMARGKYQTRNNRLVEITGSHTESGNTGGVPWSKLMWEGVLYLGDQKTIESHATWSNEGGYLHQEGVGNQLDLMTVISQEAEPEPLGVQTPTDTAVLENQLLCTAMVDVLSPQIHEGETAVEALSRIIEERDTARRMVAALLETEA